MMEAYNKLDRRRDDGLESQEDQRQLSERKSATSRTTAQKRDDPGRVSVFQRLGYQCRSCGNRHLTRYCTHTIEDKEIYRRQERKALERQKPPPVKSDLKIPSRAEARDVMSPGERDSVMTRGNETEAACDESGVSSFGEENVLNCGSDSIVTFASDGPKISEVLCDEKMEGGNEASVSSAVEMQAAVEEEIPAKCKKLLKRCIKFVNGAVHKAVSVINSV